VGVPPLEYGDGLVAVPDSLLDLGQDVGELWRDEQDALGVGLGRDDLQQRYRLTGIG
jgi:hypothetical protein